MAIYRTVIWRQDENIYADDGGGTAHGRRGNDYLTGAAGTDILHGDAGSDVLSGGAGGQDFLFGGHGGDFLYSGGGWSELWGGLGDDVLDGRGQLAGGRGGDIITITAGVAYGDDVSNRRVAGNDMIGTDYVFEPGAARAMIGGPGGDRFEISMCSTDGIGTRTDIYDFSAEDTGWVYVNGQGPGPLVRSGELFATLDSNHDGVLDGTDPASSAGVTWADPSANAFCILAPDGDMVAFWGVQRLSGEDLLL